MAPIGRRLRWRVAVSAPATRGGDVRDTDPVVTLSALTGWTGPPVLQSHLVGRVRWRLASQLRRAFFSFENIRFLQIFLVCQPNHQSCATGSNPCPATTLQLACCLTLSENDLRGLCCGVRLLPSPAFVLDSGLLFKRADLRSTDADRLFHKLNRQWIRPRFAVTRLDTADDWKDHANDPEREQQRQTNQYERQNKADHRVDH